MLGGKMTGFPWYSMGKFFVLVWFPTAIFLLGVLPALGVDFFRYPNVGYWVWLAFCFWGGFNALKWFPPKREE